MGGRYLLTGVQLGLIKGVLLGDKPESRKVLADLIDEVVENQFVMSSESISITDDIESLMMPRVDSR